MSYESAVEFVARLQRDSKFRRQYTAAKVRGDAAQFLTEMGFEFNGDELRAAREELDFDRANPEIVRDVRAIENELGGVIAAISGCNAPPPADKVSTESVGGDIGPAFDKMAPEAVQEVPHNVPRTPTPTPTPQPTPTPTPDVPAGPRG